VFARNDPACHQDDTDCRRNGCKNGANLRGHDLSPIYETYNEKIADLLRGPGTAANVYGALRTITGGNDVVGASAA
jgi:hypothetical protein